MAEYTHDFNLGSPFGALNAFGKFNNINHIVSRDVACRPEGSRGKWKLGWKVGTYLLGTERMSNSRIPAL